MTSLINVMIKITQIMVLKQRLDRMKLIRFLNIWGKKRELNRLSKKEFFNTL